MTRVSPLGMANSGGLSFVEMPLVSDDAYQIPECPRIILRPFWGFAYAGLSWVATKLQSSRQLVYLNDPVHQTICISGEVLNICHPWEFPQLFQCQTPADGGF